MNLTRLLSIVIGIATLSITAVSQAQNGPNPLARLDLEPEQQAQVEQILSEREAQVQEFIKVNREEREARAEEEREARLAELQEQREQLEAMRAEFESIEDETIEKLSEVLTPEQLTEAENLMARARNSVVSDFRDNRDGGSNNRDRDRDNRNGERDNRNNFRR